MKDALIKLVKVKSLITLMIAAGLLFGFISGRIAGDQFMQIGLMVFTFYFARQAEQNLAEASAKELDKDTESEPAK
ncbi:MAG: hypothetical protein GX572_01680 [Clostridia bacterium]|nr:hypothetical protein [Clostridia bacterium]